MIDILVDNVEAGQRVIDRIQRYIRANGYCSVEDVAHLNGVRAVQVSEIDWPLHRVGWLKDPEIGFLKDSTEDFWRIQLDDPVFFSNFNTLRYNIECALGLRNQTFFVKTPNGSLKPINEGVTQLIDTSTINGGCDGFRGGKIYDVKTLHKEDVVDVMAYSSFIEAVIGKSFKDLQKEEFRKRFEYTLTPKSIEQSVDHKTVVVLWQDGSKTIVKLSDNDKDDIDTAFAYALAKKIFGTNTHLKKVVRQKLNEHKHKNKSPKSEEVVSVEETPYGTVQQYSDGDYSITSDQTQAGLLKHFDEETKDESAQ